MAMRFHHPVPRSTGVPVAVAVSMLALVGCVDDEGPSSLDSGFAFTIDDGETVTFSHGLVAVQRDRFGDIVPGGSPTLYLSTSSFGCDSPPTTSTRASAPLGSLLTDGGGETFAQTFAVAIDGAEFSVTGNLTLSNVEDDVVDVSIAVDTLTSSGDAAVTISGANAVTRCEETN